MSKDRMKQDSLRNQAQNNRGSTEKSQDAAKQSPQQQKSFSPAKKDQSLKDR